MTKPAKKFTVGLIASLIGPTMIFAGCGYSGEKVEASNKSRFMTIENHPLNWQICADRETGVMYVVSDGTYNRGTFTLLVDANGDPLIYEGDKE